MDQLVLGILFRAGDWRYLVDVHDISEVEVCTISPPAAWSCWKIDEVFALLFAETDATLLTQLTGGRSLGAQLQILPILAAVDALHNATRCSDLV